MKRMTLTVVFLSKACCFPGLPRGEVRMKSVKIAGLFFKRAQMTGLT